MMMKFFVNSKVDYPEFSLSLKHPCDRITLEKRETKLEICNTELHQSAFENFNENKCSTTNSLAIKCITFRIEIVE